MRNFFLALSLMAMTGFAVPVITDNIVFEQTNQLVKIAYTLENEPAIVTVDILSNDVVVTGQAFSDGNFVLGPWNRKLDPGSYEVIWRPDATWPNTYLKDGTVSVRVQAWATNTPPDYMVVDLTSTTNILFATSTNALPGGIDSDLYRTSYLVMRRCPAKDVIWAQGVGTGTGQTVKHKVKFTEDYYFAVFPTTQMQYKNLNDGIAANCYFTNNWECRPVDGVGYKGMRGAKIGWGWPTNVPLHAVDPNTPLDKLRKKTGLEFDLPTSAQWEYACRAGSDGALYSGEVSAQAAVEKLGRIRTNGGWPQEFVDAYGTMDWRSKRNEEPYVKARAWTTANGTPRVGSYQPNAWGIYDLYGCLWECTLDHTYTDYTYDKFDTAEPIVDPKGEADPTKWNTVDHNTTFRDGSNWFRPYGTANSASITDSSDGGDFVRSACRLVCPAVIPADVK